MATGIGISIAKKWSHKLQFHWLAVSIPAVSAVIINSIPWSLSEETSCQLPTTKAVMKLARSWKLEVACKQACQAGRWVLARMHNGVRGVARLECRVYMRVWRRWECKGGMVRLRETTRGGAGLERVCRDAWGCKGGVLRLQEGVQHKPKRTECMGGRDLLQHLATFHASFPTNFLEKPAERVANGVSVIAGAAASHVSQLPSAQIKIMYP